jgi:hypothetical protein
MRDVTNARKKVSLCFKAILHKELKSYLGSYYLVSNSGGIKIKHCGQSIFIELYDGDYLFFQITVHLTLL